MSLSWSQVASDLTGLSGSSRRSIYSSRGKRLRTARIGRSRARMPMYKSISARTLDSVIVCRTVQRSINTTADVAWGFGFSPTYLWINGVQDVAVPGASDLTNIYDICRVAKVQCNIMFDFNVLDATAGAGSLPVVYTAYDPTDNNTPTLSSIQQMATNRIHMVGDARNGNRITRTIYPKVRTTQSTGTSSIMLTNQNQWQETGGDNPYNSLMLYVDFISSPQSARAMVCVFKIYYECKLAK